MTIGDEVQQFVANGHPVHLSAFKKRDHWDVQSLSHLNEAASTHPVRTLLVFLHLLKGDADPKRKLLLCQPAARRMARMLRPMSLSAGFTVFSSIFACASKSDCSPRHSQVLFFCYIPFSCNGQSNE